MKEGEKIELPTDCSKEFYINLDKIEKQWPRKFAPKFYQEFFVCGSCREYFRTREYNLKDHEEHCLQTAELKVKEKISQSEQILDEQRDTNSVVPELQEATDEYGNLETKNKQLELHFQQEVEEKTKSVDEAKLHGETEEINITTVSERLDGFRTAYETAIAELKEKHQDEFVKAQSAQSCIDELREQLNESRQEVTKMTESYETEILEYRKDRHGVVDERDSLMKMVERRNFEVERMEADIKSLKQQLQTAINSKCEALSKYDEIQHKEINFELKEKRLEQDRVLLQNQIDMLTTDLSRNVQELQKCRSGSTLRTMTIEAKLQEKTEEINILTSQNAHLTESNASLNTRIEEMSEKILGHGNEFTSMMEKYRKELFTIGQVAELYKKKSDEILDEQRDINSVFIELKAIIKEVTDEYGNLETKYKQLELQFQQEVEQKKKSVDELKNANELMKAAKQENIDIAVEKLCPTAATTSKLTKSGKSFTEIYVNTTEELQRVKEDYEQLKLRFSEVFQEIQEKAPIIQRTEIELEKATEVNSELNNQLDNMIRERVEIRQHSDELTMKVKSLESQTKELLRDRQDLSRQVCHLLQIIEQARGGQGPSRDESITSDMSGNEVISKRLVTFGDTLGLQQNNIKLIALVRDLTAKIEEMDELKCHMDQATYKAKIENYTRSQKIKDSEHELKTLKEEYENYRKEKRENDDMMNKQLDSLCSELREMSTIKCKLQAQVEHQDRQINNSKSTIEELSAVVTKIHLVKTILRKADTKMKEIVQQRAHLACELTSTKTLLDQRTEEHEQVIRNLKTEFDSRIQRPLVRDLTAKIEEMDERKCNMDQKQLDQQPHQESDIEIIYLDDYEIEVISEVPNQSSVDVNQIETQQQNQSISSATVINQDIQQEQSVAGSSNQEESQVPEISITGADDDYDGTSTSETGDEASKMLDTEEGSANNEESQLQNQTNCPVFVPRNKESKSKRPRRFGYKYCINCGLAFTTVRQRQDHEIKEYYKDSSWHCSKCSYKTTTLVNLRRHFPIHSNRYQCETCDFQFCHSRNLNVHQQQHRHGIYSAKAPKAPKLSANQRSLLYWQQFDEAAITPETDAA